MVRPHRIALRAADAQTGSDENRLAGSIARAVFAGDVLQYDVAVGDQLVTVEEATRAQTTPRAPGEAVTLVWRVADTLVFPASS